MSEALLEIKENDFFGNFSLDVLEDFISLGEKQIFDPDHQILQQGDQGTGIYYIVHGLVHIMKDNPQQKFPKIYVTKLGSGECFGEISAFSSNPISASVMTREETKMYHFPRTELDQYFQENKDFGLKFMKQLLNRMSDRLKMTTESLTGLKAKNESVEDEELQDLLSDIEGENFL